MRFLPTVAVAVALPAAVATADHSAPPGTTAELVTRISASDDYIGGSSERLRGHVSVRTPGAWRHDNRDGWRTVRFTAAVSDGCEVRVMVATRATATSKGPLAQVRRIAQWAQTLGEGRRPGGAWRLIHMGAGSAADLYGVAAVRVARRRWVHVRAFAFLGDGCAADVDRSGDLPVALRRLIETARVRARVVAR